MLKLLAKKVRATKVSHSSSSYGHRNQLSALLLVPRFAGFTEDARVANDRNACETIEEHSRHLLLMILSEYLLHVQLLFQLEEHGHIAQVS